MSASSLPPTLEEMDLEQVVVVLSQRLQRETHKRTREEDPPPPKTTSESPSGSDATTNTTNTPEPSEEDRLLTSNAVRDVFYTVAMEQLVPHGNYSQSRARCFVARSTCAAFYTVMAIRPQPFGPRWIALLSICDLLVTQAFDNGSVNLDTCPSDIKNKVKLVTSFATAIGMRPVDEELRILVKAARQWSRTDVDDLLKAFIEMWVIMANDPKVRSVVDAVLWPCERGYLLFR